MVLFGFEWRLPQHCPQRMLGLLQRGVVLGCAAARGWWQGGCVVCIVEAKRSLAQSCRTFPLLLALRTPWHCCQKQ